MTNETKPGREDVHALAEAFVARMKWPSMHWRTQSIDFDAAAALALVALEHAPQLLAAARLQREAFADATRRLSEGVPVEVSK